MEAPGSHMHTGRRPAIGYNGSLRHAAEQTAEFDLDTAGGDDAFLGVCEGCEVGGGTRGTEGLIAADGGFGLWGGAG